MTHTVWVGDCLDKLRSMKDETVDCCITSPPYYGLRNYGGEGRWWGGTKAPETQEKKGASDDQAQMSKIPLSENSVVHGLPRLP